MKICHHCQKKFSDEFSFCPTCGKFMADSELEIVCPNCKKTTKADGCDCGFVPTEQDVENAKCLICGGKTVSKKNKVLNCRGENGCGGAAVCIVFRNRDKFRKSVPGESAAPESSAPAGSRSDGTSAAVSPEGRG